MSFPRSKLVWEYYAGQGIEIQWLGTFGEANGYYLSGHENANLRQLLGEVLPLATKRAGGIAWEYLFQLRRRLAAVDERPLPGHRPAGARARVVALQRTGLPDRRPAGARHLPDLAAGRGAREDAGGRALRRVHLRPQRQDPQRLHPGARRAVRLHVDHQRPARAGAVRSGRRRGARRGPPLRHRGLVAVRPVRRIQPQLPRTAHRIPAAPVRTHAQRPAHHGGPGAPHPDAHNHAPRDADHHHADDDTPSGGTAPAASRALRRGWRTPPHGPRPRRSPAIRSTARPPSASPPTCTRRR